MSNKRDLVCIGCPLGCALEAIMIGNIVTKVTGNGCMKGQLYAEKECTNPTRILTSTIVVIGGNISTVSIKTQTAIPKDKILECAKLLKGLNVKAPIRIGDVVLKDIGGTGVNLIATRNIQVI